MKRFLTILLAGLVIAAITAPALAWEFSMTGEAEWRYRYFARQGQSDLFGGPCQFNWNGIADGANGFAGPVANVVSYQGFSVTGADASISDARVWFFPEIRINPAVRLRGEYWVTGTNLRGPFPNGALSESDNWVSNQGYNGWYITSDGGFGTAPGGQSIGMWEKFWGTAQTPWGIFAVGRRPFPFGLGWSTTHERDATTDSWFISVPYGPLTFIYGQELREVGDRLVENGFLTLNTASPVPFNTLRLASGTDKNRTRNHNGAFAIVYRNGPMEFGSLARYVQWDAPQHFLTVVPLTPVGAGARDDANLGALPALFLFGNHLNGGIFVPIRGDIGFVLWSTYMKYFNGRFFFNAEYDFEYADCHRRGGRPLSIWADAWEIELGAICGPAKLSLVNFYSSGNDRRGGLFIESSFGAPTGSFVNGINTYDKFTQFLVLGGRQKSIDAYEFLLGIYGGGNNSYDGRGYWTAQDFLATPQG